MKQDATDPSADRRERAYSALAWERLEERKRILKNKPMPKSVDVSKEKRSRRHSAGPTEPATV